MLALVTGATGFIGSHLTEALLEKGLKVRALVRKASNRSWLKNLPIQYAMGEFSDPNFLKEAVQGADYIFHAAGVIWTDSRRQYFNVNADATHLLAEAAAGEPGLKKFIFISSQAAGGPSSDDRGVREGDQPHPVSFYGESKVKAEHSLLEFSGKFPVVILRPPTIYGPRETRVFAAFKMLKYGFALAAGTKPKMVSFCYVKDLVDAILKSAFEPTTSGRIYNVAGLRAYEWLEFVETIARALDRPRYRLFRLPKPLLHVLGVGGEIYARLTGRSSLFTRQKVKEFAQNSWVIDGTRIRKELGWREKTNLQEGIAETAHWYQKEGWL